MQCCDVCIVDIKVLIGILGRPWLIEPTQAQHWSDIAQGFLATGNVPQFDKRNDFTRKADNGATYRINGSGAIDANGSIQVLKMDAPVAKYDFCGSPGSTSWAQMINAANADPSVKSILIIADSPGGQVDGTEMLANTVKNSAKPIVTFVDSMMCSAMYWIGSSATEIIADGANNGWNVTIGSIGTMAQFEDNSKELEQKGRKRHLVFADASTDKWGDYFSVIGGDYTRVKQELNGINDTFLASVKANRGDKLDESTLTGKTYNAKEALKLGLIDKIGSFDYAVKRAAALGKQYSKQNSAMSTTNNNAFQKVLTAAKAESFDVVDGGFLLTEEHLKEIDSEIEASNELYAQMKASYDASLLDSVRLDEALKAAQKEATDAKAALEAAEAKVKELEAGAALFSGKGSNGNNNHADEQPKKVYAHEEEADKLLGLVKK